jgi:hypothetical protein
LPAGGGLVRTISTNSIEDQATGLTTAKEVLENIEWIRLVLLAPFMCLQTLLQQC